MDNYGIQTQARLEALEVLGEIAEAVERPNGLTIAEGMEATGLAYHCFYQAALQLNAMGKIKLIRDAGQLRLIASDAPCPKEAEIFTSPAGAAGELRRFLADVTARIHDGSVSPDRAQTIAMVVAAQITASLMAAKGEVGA